MNNEDRWDGTANGLLKPLERCVKEMNNFHMPNIYMPKCRCERLSNPHEYQPACDPFIEKA